MEKSIFRKLKEYNELDYYPFHMPGHKRNMGGYELEDSYHIDITEIEDFDNLHHAEGILQEAMQRAARLYKSEETHFLVNGSTCGILSAISGTVKKRGKILLARNCHKAAYNAVFLRELQPVYVYPEMEEEYAIAGEIKPEEVARALEENEAIEAVFITSPTYDGIVSDVKEIAKIAHNRNIPLIVDEAHGAHFGFHKDFPENSVSLGADIVIHSVHKTLPAFTQTALIHMNGRIIDRDSVNRFLSIYQTSSPSYILMAGIDSCISIVDKEGNRLLTELSNRIDSFLFACKELKYIKIFVNEGQAKKVFNFDKSKLLISVKDTTINGKQLYDILLKKYHLQMEMEAATYVIAITSMMDTEDGFERLAKALKEIDHKIKEELEKKDNNQERIQSSIHNAPQEKTQGNMECGKDNNESEKELRISDLEDSEKQKVLFTDSIGKITAEFVYLYPPGIPILVPGEVITEFKYKVIESYKKQGFRVQGPKDYSLKTIKVKKS